MKAREQGDRSPEFQDGPQERLFRLDPEGRILHFDQGGRPTLFPAPEVVPGTDFTNLVDPLDRGRFREALVGLDPRQPTTTATLRLLRPGSDSRWHRLVLQSFHDPQSGRPLGSVVLVSPLGTIEGGERYLVQLAAGVEQSADGFVITDLEGDIHYVNPAFEQITGYAPDDIIGRNMRFLKSGMHSAAFYADLWRTIRAGEVWRGRITNRRRNGEFYEEHQTISPVRDGQGRITHYVAIKRDVSGETRQERELARKSRLETVGRFAGGVAHDFNNILTAILGAANLAEIALDDPATREEDIRQQLRQIADSAQDAGDLTRQLLVFARQERGETRVIDLVRVTERTLGILEHLIRPEVTLVFERPDAPVPVLGDRSGIQQVLLNLVANGQEAMPQGGRLELGLGIVHGDQGREQALILVRDQGIGMDDCVRDRIFEPFFSTKPVHTGAGLGLSNVHGIVSEMGGRIVVDSRPGEGTEFRLLLPLATPGEIEEPDWDD
ncbi:MAG: PAS domain S-box protein [Planctomycetes bacterium]|nr:PAS domain S-box protein [Planctomycetota bacterium]